MHKEGKIAVIGDKDSVLAFKAVGVDVFSTTNPFEVRELIKKLARNSYLIIYITEDLAALASDTIVKYKTRAYPAIIPIPGSNGTNGMGIDGIKADVERAIGADILFNKK